MPKLTTEGLVASVKSRTLAPTSQKTWSDSQLIEILNEELFLGLVPDIQKEKEDFFKTSKRYQVISGQKTWSIPPRALGMALEDVVAIDNQGNRFPLTRMNSRDIQKEVVTYPTYYGFLIEDDKVRLIPELSQYNNYIELRYPRRISKLVPTTRVALITNTTVVGPNTVCDVDTDLTTVLAGGLADIYPNYAPYTLLFEDVEIVAISSTQITFTTASVTNSDGNYAIGVNQYIAAPETANLIQLPEEFDPILAQQGALYLLEALGDQNKIGLAAQKLEKMRKAAFSLIANRVENTVELIRPRTGFRRYSKYGVLGGN